MLNTLFLVTFWQSTKAIVILYGQNGSYLSLSICNKNERISILVIFGQSTDAIALFFFIFYILYATI